LYWIGLYESTHVKKWEWFFHVDLTHSICYGTKRFVGGGEYLASWRTSSPDDDVNEPTVTVAGSLFALHGTLTITALCTLPVFLLGHFVSHVSLDIWLVVYVLFTACVHSFWLGVGLMVHAITSNVDGLLYRPDDCEQRHELGNTRRNFLKSMDLVPLLQSTMVSTIRSVL
jgi:hypothetical protein